MADVFVDLTGDYRTNIYAAARKLLADGADPTDAIVTVRDGQDPMNGIIGKLARSIVSDADKGGVHLARWRPFPGMGQSPGLAIEAPPVYPAPETLEAALARMAEMVI